MDLRHHPAGANLDRFTAAHEERLANVTEEQLRELGAYVKRVEGDLVQDLKDQGRPTNARAVALYVYEVNPDMFSDLLLDSE